MSNRLISVKRNSFPAARRCRPAPCGCWGFLALAILQKPLVHQGISDGGDGDAAADVVRKEQDDFTQKRGVCDLPLAAPLFPLQNVPYYHGRINAIQKGQRFFLVQPDVRDARHSAKAQIGVKRLPAGRSVRRFGQTPADEFRPGRCWFPALQSCGSPETPGKKAAAF